MTLDAAKRLLSDELLKEYQGTMLCVHSLPALKMLNVHLALIRAQLDYAFGTLQDVRMFNTLLMAPDWKGITCEPRVILAMDGFLSDGERASAAQRFPNARIIEVADLKRQTAAALSALLPDDPTLRQIYRVLRQREKMEYTWEILSQEAGVSIGMVRCGMLISEELGLVKATLDPLRYQMIPSGKVSLENSGIRKRLISLSEKE